MPSDPPLPTRFTGLRVLVVEDEVAIAMLLEDMLLELGAEVVGPVGRLADASPLVAQGVDLAVVDVNVAGEPVYPLATVLAGCATPFIFSTGYGAGGIDAEWRDRPVLQKPFSQPDLERALTLALAG